MHPGEIPITRPRAGVVRRLRRTTKKRLVPCPHCGLPVDPRAWAEHRQRVHEAIRKERKHA